MSLGGRIAIIGGGWAGLSCAAWLTRVAPDSKITVFEASPHFGGRARGLNWEIPDRDTTLAIDNGQHLTIGAYTDTFALLRMVGAPRWQSRPLQWAGVTSHAVVAQHWQVSEAAWPWRVLSGLIPGRGPIGWPLAWKWAIGKTILQLVASNWRVGPITAHQWLATQDMPKDFVDHFWRPLCEGALNTELELASADILAAVLRDSLAGPKGSTNVLTPPTNLSVDGVDPITNWLAQQGVNLAARHLVTRLEQTSTGTRLHCRDQPVPQVYQHVVLAMPARPSIRLWDDSALPMTPARQRWAGLDFRPITTVWIALNAAQSQQLAHLPDWFVLNPHKDAPHIGQVVVKRNGAIGVVVSAHGIGNADQARDLLNQQLVVQLGIACQDSPQKWITEKHATWAATPNAPIASEEETRGLTGLPNIYRCADDCEPGYPATIESAVRSGKRTAETISRASLQSHHPDATPQ
ncbi:FAD-dependent oxidoreductase [beta proteobacterium MWH-UniP1]